MKKELQQGLRVKGIHTFTVCEVVSERARRLEEAIMRASRNGDNRLYATLLQKFHGLFSVNRFQYENLVVNDGLEVHARLAGGDTTFSGNVDWGAIGTATTAVTATDTQLGAEVFRKERSSKETGSVTTGIITLNWFFTTGDFTESDVNEWGTFVDGSASANSGQLYSHLIFSETINKTALKTLTVDVQYTYQND